MGARHILAIDQGTTNTKALLFDESSRVVARASQSVDVRFPQPGWVEQDGEAIWRTVTAAIGACLDQAPRADVTAIALSNQRESALVWDRQSGRPSGPVIVWQCRRTGPMCAAIAAAGAAEHVRMRTGLPVDPLFSATKVRWLLESIPNGIERAERGELCAGTIDSWLMWKLTGGRVHACDASNASRTQLFDIHTARWDPDMLTTFGVPAAMLPVVRDSSGVFGEVRGLRPLDGVPIASAIGDSHAALFGHAAFETGVVKATYGTGSSLMASVPTAAASTRGLATTIAWRVDGVSTYALEGNITVTGSAVDWLGGVLARPGGASDIAALADAVSDTGGVYVVPAFAGLGAPYWDADARGIVCGLTRGTTAAHIARATIESIAFQVADVFEAMATDSSRAAALLADGGASRNDSLMQFQADILGVPVIRRDAADVSACGTAWLAGRAVGLWDAAALRAIPRAVSRFEPRMSASTRAAKRDGWASAIAMACARQKGGREWRGSTSSD